MSEMGRLVRAEARATSVQARRGGFAGACLVGALLWTTPAQAGPCDRSFPWSRLSDSATRFAAPLPLSLAAGALIAPALMAPTGLDHDLRVVAQRDLGGTYDPEPVSVVTPYVLPGLLVVVDAVALHVDACDVARPASAMLQAAILTAISFTAMKWITSRPFPTAGGDPRDPDRLERPEQATHFYWFDWSEGYAWPSGHTATMVAAAAALGAATGYRSGWAYVVYAAAAGVAAGMWLGDHHWGSDIVSGALLGAAVGHSVGLAFRADGAAAGASPSLSIALEGRQGNRDPCPRALLRRRERTLTRRFYDMNRPNSNRVGVVPTWAHHGPNDTLSLTTLTYHVETGEVLDVDLELNGMVPWAFDAPEAGQYDLEAALTHEVGHMLGLAHSSVPEATMSAIHAMGSIDLRTLAPDDEAGICAVYPSRGKRLAGSGVVASTACNLAPAAPNGCGDPEIGHGCAVSHPPTATSLRGLGAAALVATAVVLRRRRARTTSVVSAPLPSGRPRRRRRRGARRASSRSPSSP